MSRQPAPGPGEPKVVYLVGRRPTSDPDDFYPFALVHEARELPDGRYRTRCGKTPSWTAIYLERPGSGLCRSCFPEAWGWSRSA